MFMFNLIRLGHSFIGLFPFFIELLVAAFAPPTMIAGHSNWDFKIVNELVI